MRTVKVGLCGFSMSRAAYPLTFPVVEVQQTFYEPPSRADTLANWRRAMPQPFEFTLKAWQLITHASSSPTYRRLKRRKLSARELAGVGGFKATKIVAEGWARTVECAATLSATAILFQCPASFTQTRENVASLRAFMERIERPKNVRLMWEPRGPWQPAVLARLCDDLELVHVVDPFVTKPRSKGPTYFRLHGIHGWRHAYTDAELANLVARIPARGETYVMFNNSACVADAKRLLALVAPEGQPRAGVAPLPAHP